MARRTGVVSLTRASAIAWAISARVNTAGTSMVGDGLLLDAAWRAELGVDFG